MRAADRKQNVARIQRAGGAGGAGGGADALVVEQEQEGFALDALEAEVDVAGQAAGRVAVERAVRDLGQALNQAVAHRGQTGHGLGQVLHGLFQSGRHAHDAGNVLGTCSLALLLRAALDQVREDDAALGVEQADALRAVELVGGEGEHVDVVVYDVDRNVADGLDRVGVEEDACFAADRADLTDWLDGADLVVRVHDRDQAGLGRDRFPDLLGRDQAVLVDVQIGHGEALFFELLQRVEHGVVLKGRGDDVGLALLFADDRGAADGLVVGLGAAGGEGDLSGICAQDRCAAGAGVLQGFLGFLTDRVEARGVAEDGLHIGQHRVDGRPAHLGRCSVVSIDSHGVPPCIRLPIILVGLSSVGHYSTITYFVNR